ncbi:MULTISPECIES: aldehyde dehydrogenase [Mycolicibacterium]|uniref:Aldehyde dehydrogenase n=3 Tax=Mycolicibacterium TaxID=1866885 RepID=A0AAE5AF46_MYCFO|nr:MULTISPECIES: aldehyde dehydrogenase [Mycolicibacterium]MDV7193417.1 aldehyde dehydrogenase [Mycolicibacterium fortuitum]MDV7206814.1 aldehyde dehydrogenase [Mycolicibacterium fortuitum]MDV7228332.1 aldehyde dehydrogenase [Mycolicibacterium fortuitum]MDV7260440.1 aldehyde dehydrogenase [Mycolicibacterium fortuitum]MDV7285170.1 aldehyde dehydrogenase [Mycolicibacterium fortuitum]
MPELASMIELAASYVAGKWVTSAAAVTMEVASPTTGEVLGTVGIAGDDEVSAAVAAARTALPTWAQTSPADRGAALGRLADALTARKGGLADLATAEIGSPRSWSTFGQVITATGVLRAYAAITPDHPFSSSRPSMTGGVVDVRQVPVGVVAAIVPWNTPLFIAVLKLGPALAAGCTVVLKPAPDAPLSFGVLMDAVEEAGIPDGVVNVVNGGAVTGELLTEHPDVDKVSFTGSTAVGARIAASCGSRIRRCSTELGGKSAAIVLPDAPIEKTVAGLVGGVMGNNGQLCAALTRILLPRSRYDEYATALTAAVSTLTVGDPAERSTDIGPLINEAARDKVEGLLRRARDEGATVLTGGERPDRPGWFVTPAVVEATNDMEIAREEVFGPVVVVIAYDDIAEAVAIANDSRYGLVGAVWSADEERAATVATQLQAGSIAVNSTAVLDFGSPFGGFKESGIGREGGPEGITGFVEYQAIIR